MRTPLLVQFARPVTGDIPPMVGRYDAQLGLRVVESADGEVPVASRIDYTRAVTKTDHRKEGDDRSAFLASITKTGEPREKDDPENEFPEASREAEVSGQQDWLALVTKTLTHRERDDEPVR
jgi:hypothetical protein